MESLKLFQPPQDNFSGTLLSWARESRGLTQHELAERVGTTQGYISKVEDGQQTVSEETVNRIVGVLGYPRDFYHEAETLPTEPTSFFRRHLTLKATLLKQAAARMRITRRRILRLLRSVDGPPIIVPRIDSQNFQGGPAAIARHIRHLWNVPSGPIKNLVQVVENAGCFVIPFDFGTNKIDGCSEWSEGVPIIFFNASVSPVRLRAIVAHEIGHIIMHQTEFTDAEREAHLFCGEFLTPEAEIKSTLLPISLDRLARLKLQWKVSMQLLLKRAEELNVISARNARYHWMLLTKAGYKEVEPHEYDIPRENPTLFPELMQAFLEDMGLSKEKLAEYIWASDSEFETLHGGRPHISILNQAHR